MNCKLINALMFAVGAAIGSAVTWKVVKTKYERIAQEEIESVKETFAEYFTDHDDASTDEATQEDEEPAHQIDWSELEDLDEEDNSTDDGQNDYTRLVEQYTNNEKGGAENMTNAPYVISPYDFGELDGYRQIELTYYEGDDTLEDDEYNIVNDRNELIGADSLFTFGEYEDDAVFVRNERLRTEFQILKDYRSYAEARSIGPDQVGNE